MVMERMRYGCTDCGEVFAKKADVPQGCRPFTIRVVRSESAFGGYRYAEDVEDVFELVGGEWR